MTDWSTIGYASSITRACTGSGSANAVSIVTKGVERGYLPIDNVLSDIMGVTGQRIVRAMVAGERDGTVLAQLRDPRVKADAATIARSLRGTWRDEHLFALEQALECYDLLNRQIKGAETRIDALVETLADTVDESAVELLAQPARTAPERRRQLALRAMLGVDLTAMYWLTAS